MLKELIKYYQEKYQSVPVSYPGSGAIEEMFEYLSTKGISQNRIREIIIEAIDRKFSNYHPHAGFISKLSIGKTAEKEIELMELKRNRLKTICLLAVKKAVRRNRI